MRSSTLALIVPVFTCILRLKDKTEIEKLKIIIEHSAVTCFPGEKEIAETLLKNYLMTDLKLSEKVEAEVQKKTQVYLIHANVNITS